MENARTKRPRPLADMPRIAGKREALSLTNTSSSENNRSPRLSLNLLSVAFLPRSFANARICLSGFWPTQLWQEEWKRLRKRFAKESCGAVKGSRWGFRLSWSPPTCGRGGELILRCQGARRRPQVEATDALVIQLTPCCQSVLAVMLAKAGLSAITLLPISFSMISDDQDNSRESLS
ncbi:hypothetical protein L6452_39398 [Arctium lappa]|uniref:Uncharacterized protein n=1 Tax=Arctium lappa TaxID=4217 RepID=A0ACB8XS74_ARCLA|nr:hypothetical protein L6452_39398 [Arctium lappa]